MASSTLILSLDKAVNSISDCVLIEELGYGSFGRTFLASCKVKKPDQTIYEVPIVVKEVDPAFVNEVCGVSCAELIYQEGSEMKLIRHQNLIRIYNIFFEDDKLYQIIEYCPEGNLQKIIDSRHGKLISESRIQLWFGQLASALSLMHEKQIAHCSIKAENILSSSNHAVVKLADAGTAHVFLNSQKDVVNESIAKTLLHYPPEVFTTQDERSGVKIDVWMLGVVIYQMTTLNLPFPLGTGDVIRDAIINTEPQPISEKYSTALRTLVDRMLTKKPVERCDLDDVVCDPYLLRVLNPAGGRRLSKANIDKFLPSTEQIQKYLSEIESLSFHHKWPKSPKRTLLKAPSGVRAILPVFVGSDKFQSLLVVCADGEILFLSRVVNFESINWAAKVFVDVDEANSKDKFGIFHAVYHEKSDRLFFVLVSPHREHIFYTTRREITPQHVELTFSPLKSAERFRLRTYTPESSPSATDRRQFWGLAIDDKSNLLYAGANRDITVWSLAALDPNDANDSEKMLVGVINCDDIEGHLQIEPRYLAFSTVGESKLAVSDYVNNRVCLFVAKKSTSENSNNKNTEDTTEEVPASLPVFESKIVIASKSAEYPLETGSVLGPCELWFDSTGNLLVTEFSNKRVQIFSFSRSENRRDEQKPRHHRHHHHNQDEPQVHDDDPQHKSGKGSVGTVWMSNTIAGGPYRLAIVKSVEPIMIVSQHSSNDIVCFE